VDVPELQVAQIKLVADLDFQHHVVPVDIQAVQGLANDNI
jgi:hypothetical protein